MADLVRGRLSVILMGARIWHPPPDAPYAVIQFDNSEFVSRSAAVSTTRKAGESGAEAAEADAAATDLEALSVVGAPAHLQPCGECARQRATKRLTEQTSSGQGSEAMWNQEVRLCGLLA